LIGSFAAIPAAQWIPASAAFHHIANIEVAVMAALQERGFLSWIAGRQCWHRLRHILSPELAQW
jgi:hypothetical protein